MKKYLFMIEVHSDGVYEIATIEGESFEDPTLRKKLAEAICACGEGDDFNHILGEEDRYLAGNTHRVRAYEIVGERLEVPDIMIDAKRCQEKYLADWEATRKKQKEDQERREFERLKQQFEGDEGDEGDEGEET